MLHSVVRVGFTAKATPGGALIGQAPDRSAEGSEVAVSGEEEAQGRRAGNGRLS